MRLDNIRGVRQVILTEIVEAVTTTTEKCFSVLNGLIKRKKTFPIDNFHLSGYCKTLFPPFVFECQ